jgi:hypothetical protein
MSGSRSAPTTRSVDPNLSESFAVDDVGLRQDLAPGAHDLGDGLAVAGHLQQFGRDQGRRLGDVEL